MLDKERLIKAPTITAEEVADDDYILIDSPTLGVRKYLASKLLPEPLEYLYKWDFTKEVDPLIDEIQGVGLNEIATYTPKVGLQFLTNKRQFINIPVYDATYDMGGKTVEIDYGSVDAKGGNVLIQFKNSSKSSSCDLEYFNGQLEIFKFNNIVTLPSSYTGRSNPNLFNESTLKFVVNTNHSCKVYKNDDLVVETDSPDTVGMGNIIIGNSYNYALHDVTIKAIRVYETIEEV